MRETQYIIPWWREEKCEEYKTSLLTGYGEYIIVSYKNVLSLKLSKGKKQLID